MSESAAPINTLESSALARPGGGQAEVAGAARGRRALALAFVASLTGTALEWYDFAIFSSSAARPRRSTVARTWRRLDAKVALTANPA
jgi:hypothetical protein